MADPTCYLKKYVNCPNKGNFQLVGVERLRSSSERRDDDLINHWSSENDSKYWCHKNCISTYSSKYHMKYAIADQNQDNYPPEKRSRRSDQDRFCFKEHVFCVPQYVKR